GVLQRHRSLQPHQPGVSALPVHRRALDEEYRQNGVVDRAKLGPRPRFAGKIIDYGVSATGLHTKHKLLALTEAWQWLISLWTQSKPACRASAHSRPLRLVSGGQVIRSIERPS